MTTTTAIAAQAVETVCDECAGEGSSRRTWWQACGYLAAPPRTGPPTTASGSCARLPMRRHRPVRARSGSRHLRQIRPITPRGPGVPSTLAQPSLGQADHRWARHRSGIVWGGAVLGGAVLGDPAGLRRPPHRRGPRPPGSPRPPHPGGAGGGATAAPRPAHGCPRCRRKAAGSGPERLVLECRGPRQGAGLTLAGSPGSDPAPPWLSPSPGPRVAGYLPAAVNDDFVDQRRRPGRRRGGRTLTLGRIRNYGEHRDVPSRPALHRRSSSGAFNRSPGKVRPFPSRSTDFKPCSRVNRGHLRNGNDHHRFRREVVLR